VITALLLILFGHAGCTAATQEAELPAMLEALVIIDESHADDVLSQIGRIAVATQRLPPRLAIVKGEASQLEAVRNLPGVSAVYTGDVPEPVLQRLSPTEQIFAEAWAIGRRPKTSRPGDGLPWDAEGFEPPDLIENKPRR
jgi:hypothetical protein